MIRNKRQGFILSAGLLGATTVLGVSAANAAPRHNDRRSDVREEKRDVKEARKDVKDARKDARKADTPWERREAREDVRDAQRDLRDERQDLRRERREENREDNRYGNRYDNRYRNGYNPNWNRPGYPSGGYYGAQSFTGVVTNVRSDQSFDVRIGGGTYNVYLNNVLPRQLNVGDQVRVYGVRYGSNDIRNASVTIIRNR
jgi:hypothetical protein